MVAERSENSGPSRNAAAQNNLSSAGRQKLLERVQVLYEKSFHRLPEGKAYLTRHGITDPRLWNRHRIGYCSGTMTGLLPSAGEAVDGLKALGVLTDQGEECLRGCVTFPIVDQASTLCAIWGRRITGADPADLHVPPGQPGAVWNGGGTGPMLFITESILDGLSLCQAGFESVIALVGVWMAEHETWLRQCKPGEVLLCLGSDPGERETERQLREGVLPALGIAVHTVCWPEGVKNANSFFLKHSRTDFEVLLAKARPGRHLRSQRVNDPAPEQMEQIPEGFVARCSQRR